MKLAQVYVSSFKKEAISQSKRLNPKGKAQIIKMYNAGHRSWCAQGNTKWQWARIMRHAGSTKTSASPKRNSGESKGFDDSSSGINWKGRMLGTNTDRFQTAILYVHRDWQTRRLRLLRQSLLNIRDDEKLSQLVRAWDCQS